MNQPMWQNQSFEQTPDRAWGIVSSPWPALLNSVLGAGETNEGK